MKRFVIEIEYYRHLVEASEEVVDSLDDYYRNFNIWLNDKGNDHGYWEAMLGDPDDPADCSYGCPHDPDGRDGLCFDADAFLKWLNENHCGEAKIIATESASTGTPYLRKPLPPC
jgi:hypothetical protein